MNRATSAEIRAWARAAGLSENDTEVAVTHYERRSESSEWLQWLTLSQTHLFERGGPAAEVSALADSDEAMAMLDRLVLALHGVPQLFRRHREIDVEDAVTKATARDLSRWTEYFRRELGTPGINARILGWYQRHCLGSLFEIGRLQFVPTRFEGPVRGYVSKRTDDIVVFCDDGVRFDTDGLAPARGRACPNCVDATLRIDDHLVTGNPIEPSGHIRIEPLSLVAAEWSCFLEEGTPVVEIHIPAGNSLDLEACAEALADAWRLIPSWFPDHRFSVFVCEAWLLDPRLERVLSPTSNIIRFARRFYRYSVEDDPSEARARVFGEGARHDGIAAVPRDTTLRTRFAEYLESGGTVTAAGGFYRADDLPFREAVYLTVSEEQL